MKKDEFHVPFIKNLVLIVVVTLVSMGTAHFLIQNYLSTPQNIQVFTSSNSQISSESPQ